MLNAGMQRSGEGYFCVKVFSVLMVLVLENLCVVQLWSQAFFGQLRGLTVPASSRRLI